jgi:hypothetical protein
MAHRHVFQDLHSASPIICPASPATALPPFSAEADLKLLQTVRHSQGRQHIRLALMDAVAREPSNQKNSNANYADKHRVKRPCPVLSSCVLTTKSTSTAAIQWKFHFVARFEQLELINKHLIPKNSYQQRDTCIRAKRISSQNTIQTIDTELEYHPIQTEAREQSTRMLCDLLH